MSLTDPLTRRELIDPASKAVAGAILLDQLADPLKQAANVRDGAVALLISVAARRSIDTGTPVHVAELTDMTPQAKKPE
jgi:hypothetical protein